MKKGLLILLVLVLSISFVSATEVIINASKGDYASLGKPFIVEDISVNGFNKCSLAGNGYYTVGGSRADWGWLLRFNESIFNSDAIVQEAKIIFYLKDPFVGTGSASINRVLEQNSWDERGIYGCNGTRWPSGKETPLTAKLSNVSINPGDTTFTLDITSFVQGIINKSYYNNGLSLYSAGGVSFWSGNAPFLDKTPRIYVKYTTNYPVVKINSIGSRLEPGQRLNFDASNTIPSSGNTKESLRYSWNFERVPYMDEGLVDSGDITPNNVLGSQGGMRTSFTTQQDSIGDYIVSLNVTDSQGRTSTGYVSWENFHLNPHPRMYNQEFYDNLERKYLSSEQSWVELRWKCDSAVKNSNNANTTSGGWGVWGQGLLYLDMCYYTVKDYDPALASAYKSAAFKYYQYILRDCKLPGDGLGLVEGNRDCIISYSSGYPIRRIGPALNSFYDVFYNDPDYTPALKQELFDRMYEWWTIKTFETKALLTFRIPHNIARPNYYALEQFVYVTYEDNPYIEELYQRYKLATEEAIADANEIMPGGFNLEGWGYGGDNVLLNVVETWEGATGASLRNQPFKYVDNLFMAAIQHSIPGFEGYSFGDGVTSLQIVHGPYARTFYGTLIGRYAQYMISHYYTTKLLHTSMDYEAAFNWNPYLDEEKPANLPLSYLTEVSGVVSMRDSWDYYWDVTKGNATWAFFQSGRPSGFAHQGPDELHFEIGRNNRVILINGGTKMDGGYGAQTNQIVLNLEGDFSAYENGTLIKSPVSKSYYPYTTATGSGGYTKAYFDNGDYLYASGHGINDPSNAFSGGNNYLLKATRNLVYIRPDLFIVHDRAQTAKEIYAKILMHNFDDGKRTNTPSEFEPADTVSVSEGTIIVSNNMGDGLLIKPLYPEVRIDTSQIVSSGKGNYAREGMIIPLENKTYDNFLTIYTVGDKSVQFPSYQTIDSANALGILTSGKLFMFNKYDIPLKYFNYNFSYIGSLKTLITELKPNTQYSIKVNNGNAMSKNSDGNGTIEFDYSYSGNSNIVISSGTNSPPEFVNLQNQQTLLGNKVSFNVAGTDADRDVLDIYAVDIPFNASFINNKLEWQTTPNDGGVYSLTFGIFDGAAIVEKTITLDVSGSIICTDADGDNYNSTGGWCGLADCNDSNANIKPGIAEVCSDKIDNNCNNYIDCAESSCKSIDACLSQIVDSVQIVSGVNFVSVPGKLKNLSIDYLIGANKNKIRAIYGYDNGWKIYYPDKLGLSSLQSLSYGRGYIIIANQSFIINFSGKFDAQEYKGFTPGWNLIGISATSKTVSSYTSGVNYSAVYKLNDARTGYTLLTPSDSMYGNEAYWIYVRPNNTCVGTCSSLGYECGMQNICGTSVNCGACAVGNKCELGKCVVDVVAVCNNNLREGSEECDGSDDSVCPGKCLSNCSCNLSSDGSGGGGSGGGAIILPIASYKFEGNLLDSSGNSNDGIGNGTITFAAGKVGNAAVFNGNSYVDLGKTLIPADGNSSFFVWVNAVDSSNRGIISQYASGVVGRLRLNIQSDGKLNLQIGSTCTSNISVGTGWHHIGFIKKGNSVAFYRDAQEVGKCIFTDSVYQANTRLGWGPDSLFNGMMDEAKIWNKALDAYQIAQEYSL